MAIYTVSSDSKYAEFYRIVLDKLKRLSEGARLDITESDVCGRHYAYLSCGDEIYDKAVLLLQDIAKDLVLINYKYLFFRNNLKIDIKDSSLKSLFYTAVTLYDREYDEQLLSINRTTSDELAVDSLFRFGTAALLKRWQGVLEIISQNFYNDEDRDAIIEFVKHIIYSLPSRSGELNIYAGEDGYRLTDADGKDIADLTGEFNVGEVASKIMLVSPTNINFYDEKSDLAVQFLKNIFCDRIRFY